MMIIEFSRLLIKIPLTRNEFTRDSWNPIDRLIVYSYEETLIIFICILLFDDSQRNTMMS